MAAQTTSRFVVFPTLVSSTSFSRLTKAAMARESWEKSLVWYCLSEDSLWLPGKVLNCVPSPNRATSPLDHWIFHLSDDKDIEGKVIILETKPMDSSCLEFTLIKRRDSLRDDLTEISDMTSLSYLNEPEMIACLKARYDHELIYTNIGTILIAINPFKQLNPLIYSVETIQRYSASESHTASPRSADSSVQGPHVFQVSKTAYQKMFLDRYNVNKREDQAILINGESGAGKTESTKQVLRYLTINSSHLMEELGVTGTSLQGDSDDEYDDDDDDTTKGPLNLITTRQRLNQGPSDLEALINAVNPITESFGNAKTSRNNNSSRFGKFIELCYSGDGYIIGAHIQTYLLETIRVISQVRGERNYHIFYEIFKSLTKKQREQWGCDDHDITLFHYLNQSEEYHRYDNESDEENYSRLIDALMTLDLTIDDDINSILKTVIAILHLGNIHFISSLIVGDDAAVFAPHTMTHVQHVCSLLGIDETILTVALTKRGLKVAGNYILKNLNVESAVIARDTYAKTLYDLLFKTLLRYINNSLSLENNSPGDEQASSSIGVLDIFGFEYFEKNSFEQLW
jgi:myosin V